MGLGKWQAFTGLDWPVELSCIGVLLFGFFAPGEADPRALQAEAYTRDGRRVPHRVDGENVRRWTLGSTQGRVFEVPPATGPPVGVAICEAPAEALAIAATQPRTLVLAVGDRRALSASHVRGHLPRRLPVRLYGGRGAHRAAREAGEELAALGYDVGRPWLPPLDAPYRCDFADYRAGRTRPGCRRAPYRRRQPSSVERELPTPDIRRVVDLQHDVRQVVPPDDEARAGDAPVRMEPDRLLAPLRTRSVEP